MGFANVGAVVDFQGAPVDEVLVSFERSLALAGADDTLSWASSPDRGGPTVALFQSRIHTLPEDSLPIALSRDGRTPRLAADVRLDNRTDLIRTLAPCVPPMPSDTALLVDAYDRWGTDCARHLRGDFAFVLWDERERLLLAARDLFGVRGLLYAREGARLLVASTITGVLAGLRQRPHPNINHLKNFIAGRPAPLPVETAHQSVRWIPPGHQLLARNGTITVARYDQLRPATVSVRTQADATEQFRALLINSVEVRLRGRDRIGFLVSGGFDSSSILCLANQAVEQGRCSLELRSYSGIFQCNRKADEREYLNAVLVRCRHVIPTNIYWDDRAWSLDLLGEGDGFPMEEPPESSRFLGVPLTQRAVRDGCRVVLAGTWADQLLLRNPYLYGELFWEMPASNMAREWRHFLRESPRRVLLTLGPAILLRARGLLATMGIGARPDSAHASLLRRHFVRGRHAAIMNSADRHARFAGAERRYPFLDRALHEFVMAVPARFLFGGGQGKRILRLAMADRLPVSFQARTTFGAVTHLYAAGVNRERHRIEALLTSPMILEAGLVSPRRIARLLARIAPDMPPPLTVEIQRLLAVELWLRKQSEGLTPGRP